MNTIISIKRAALFTAVYGIASLGTIPLRATVLDLTTAGSSGTINGAFFATTDTQPTGSGVIDSFVRIQNNGVEGGYNSSVRPVMPDVNTSTTFTRDVQLSTVPIRHNPTGAAPGDYYEFLLDINQTSANPLLTLFNLQIWTRSTVLTTADTLAALTTSGATKRYDLDTGSDSRIQLNYSLNSGSGSGDMFFYLPVGALAGVPTTSFVYLYSAFGLEDPSQGGTYYATNDGYEEWAVRTSTPSFTVADGSTTISLLGGALLALAALRRRLKLA